MRRHLVTFGVYMRRIRWHIRYFRNVSARFRKTHAVFTSVVRKRRSDIARISLKNTLLTIRRCSEGVDFLQTGTLVTMPFVNPAFSPICCAQEHRLIMRGLVVSCSDSTQHRGISQKINRVRPQASRKGCNDPGGVPPGEGGISRVDRDFREAAENPAFHRGYSARNASTASTFAARAAGTAAATNAAIRIVNAEATNASTPG
jgi:hypothetical protein